MQYYYKASKEDDSEKEKIKKEPPSEFKYTEYEFEEVFDESGRNYDLIQRNKNIEAFLQAAESSKIDDK